MLIVKREEERTTRERILFMLKQQGTLTAREMTADLGLTGMAIRRHLTALEQDGWIEVRECRTIGRSGWADGCRMDAISGPELP